MNNTQSETAVCDCGNRISLPKHMFRQVAEGEVDCICNRCRQPMDELIHQLQKAIDGGKSRLS